LDTGDLNEEEVEQYAYEAAVEFAMSELPGVCLIEEMKGK